jgi:hypothetical protein
MQNLLKTDQSMKFRFFAQSCSGEPPVHRDFHSATAIGTNMYIFGGRSDLTVHGGHVGNLLPQDYYSNKVLPVVRILNSANDVT